MHSCMNRSQEKATSVTDPRDFSNIVKVDTHIHLAAAMTSKALFEFMKEKHNKYPDDVVYIDNGKPVTLSEMFKKCGIDMESLSVDALDVRADNTFNRFDNFNAKYNPFGLSDLRTIFLKTENHMNGRYFAELTQDLFDKMEEQKYIYAEFRVSVYGSKMDQWDELAKWVVNNKLFSDKNRWLVQIPRIFDVWKKTKALDSFQDLLSNIFLPLWQVTIDPSSHPELHIFLQHVVGIDSVDDESKMESPFLESNLVAPANWNEPSNPPYAYWCYYLYANLTTINKLRKSKVSKFPSLFPQGNFFSQEMFNISKKLRDTPF